MGKLRWGLAFALLFAVSVSLVQAITVSSGACSGGGCAGGSETWSVNHGVVSGTSKTTISFASGAPLYNVGLNIDAEGREVDSSLKFAQNYWASGRAGVDVDANADVRNFGKVLGSQTGWTLGCPNVNVKLNYEGTDNFDENIVQRNTIIGARTASVTNTALISSTAGTKDITQSTTFNAYGADSKNLFSENIIEGTHGTPATGDIFNIAQSNMVNAKGLNIKTDLINEANAESLYDTKITQTNLDCNTLLGKTGTYSQTGQNSALLKSDAGNILGSQTNYQKATEWYSNHYSQVGNNLLDANAFINVDVKQKNTQVAISRRKAITDS